ncbi:hypothetical protein UNDYM_3041 [Undibacterium sp. YM2]|nr:hypothetical protein UNDYM_3041 [Undibacterium sp. YM2]
MIQINQGPSKKHRRATISLRKLKATTHKKSKLINNEKIALSPLLCINMTINKISEAAKGNKITTKSNIMESEELKYMHTSI